MQVYDGEGASLPSLPLAALGMPPVFTWAAHVSAPTSCLVLADALAGPCRLVALNPSTRELRWSVKCEDVIACTGIAVLPTQGAIVLSSGDTSELIIRRLSDGVRAGSLAVSDSLVCFLAGDPSNGTVFGIMDAPDDPTASVQAWSCAADGSCLTPAGPVVALGMQDAVSVRPLAVVPPASGKLISLSCTCTGWRG